MGIQLSVVIAACSGAAPASRCIRSLDAAGARLVCEVIVAAPDPVALQDWARVLAVPGESSVAGLRAAGLAAARAPRVAVLSEDYTVGPGWLERALAAEADVTAGMTVPPPDASLAVRAAWLWEYAHLAPPLPAGRLDERSAALAPAGNVVYRRDRVSPEELRSGGHELVYHRRMHAAGLRFERDPALAAVYHPPALAQFLRDRSRWSRAWALPRARKLGRLARMAAAAARLLLPPLLLARFARCVARRPRYWLTCLAALPLFAAFACAQACGEAFAYLQDG